MKFFTKFGDLVIRLFDIIGILILSIPQIPGKLRNNKDNIKDRVDTNTIKQNINKLKEDGKVKDVINNFRGKSKVDHKRDLKHRSDSKNFGSEEKERSVFQLQILSAAFLVLSILYIFSYLPFILYCIFGLAIIAYFLYLLYNKIKLMYSEDFNAYRDFFLMYIAAGIILVLISYNQDLMSVLSFPFLPSASILIYALILVAAIFLIFRIRYHRDFTYGTVIESGKKTAYVKVDYDIRSNVKPDIYIVQNDINAKEDDAVMLRIEEKIISTGGNKPISIIKRI